MRVMDGKGIMNKAWSLKSVTDESLQAITLSIAGPKSDDDKWELEPVTPLKVRNFPPCFITAWHCVQFSLIAGLQ